MKARTATRAFIHMRLPFSKLARAFPELDSFNGRQCKRFIWLAQVRQPFRMAVCICAALIVVVVIIVGGFYLLGVAHARYWQFFNRSHDVVHAVLLALPFVLAIVAGLFMRDYSIRMLVKRRITSMRCTDCSYGLLGLTPARTKDGQDAVKCPECGFVNHLRSRGVSKAEFLALSQGTAPPQPAQEPPAETPQGP
jgi:phage FluMu protein Com